MTPPGWLRNAALAVYPPGLRDRYGPEIADLLDHSTRPWRDLADVARNACLERLGTVRRTPVRPYAVRMGALLAAPVMFSTALLLLTPFMAIASGALGAVAGQLSGTALVATVAALNARQWTDASRIPAAAVVVPTMLALGSFGTVLGVLTLSSAIGLQQGEGSGAGFVALPESAVVWWVTLTTLAARHRSLLRHGRTTAARYLVIAATVVTPVLSGLVYAALAGPGYLVSAFLTFPALVAVCTPFAFALLRISATRESATREGRRGTEA